MTDLPSGLSHPQKEYFAYLGAGEFKLQRSRETGKYIFHPKVAEEGTGCTDLDWVRVSGKGTIYSTTVVRLRPPKADYNVALIDLAEGPRMMSRVDGVAPDEVKIGMAVEARIIQQDDAPLLVFIPT